MGFGNNYKSWGESYRRIVEQWVNFNENGEGFNARSSKSPVSFVGTTLLSYRTPVAVYHQHGKQKFVLRSKETYSPTTSRHITISCSYVNVPVFMTTYVGESGGRNREGARTLKEMHAENARLLWEDLLRVLDKIGKSYREEHYGNYIEYRKHAARLYAELAAYREISGQAAVALTPINELLEEADRVNAENQHRYYHPNSVARRERAAARRIGRIAFGITTSKEGVE
jgi:hypothetical protein